MTTTITYGATTVTPDLVLGYETSTDTTAIVHTVLGAASPSVTLGVEKLRTGTLNLFFSSYTAAWAARAALSVAGVFTLVDTDFPALGMRFVRQGSMTPKLSDSLKSWTLDVGYAEVS